MDALSISQAAARSGFGPSTLRFYERSGLIEPGRSQAGYRRYDETDLGRLAVIGRGKKLGLTLDEIDELLDQLDHDDCAPVQHHLRSVLTAKIADARHGMAELMDASARLQAAVDGLDHHTPDGPCDDICGCRTPIDAPDALVASDAECADEPFASGRPTITCTLDAGQVEGRIGQWERCLEGATRRTEIPGGFEVTFPANTDAGAIAVLAAAEQRCCSFFTFRLTIAADSITLAVTGPPDARPLMYALAQVCG